MEGCPVEAIGNNGEGCNQMTRWIIPTAYRGAVRKIPQFRRK